jgi:hypothetical protein
MIASPNIAGCCAKHTGNGGKPAWGAKPFPKSDRLVTLATGFASDQDSLPIWAGWSGRDWKPARASTTGAVEVNGVRRARDGGAIHDEAAVKITALEGSGSRWSTMTSWGLPQTALAARMSEAFKHGVDQFTIAPDFLPTAIGHFLAVGHPGTMPPFGLVRFLEAVGVSSVQPGLMSPAALLNTIEEGRAIGADALEQLLREIAPSLPIVPSARVPTPGCTFLRVRPETLSRIAKFS